MQRWADECVKFYHRTKIADADIESSAQTFLEKKGWTTSTNKTSKKQLKLCRSKLKEAKKTEDAARRFQTSENQAISIQISEQNWPNVKLRNADEKGTGAFAANDIKKDTLLCDYHGTLVDDEEGWRRFTEYGTGTNNCYMLQFQFGSAKYWIYAVVQCQCNPNKKTKGRILNNSRKKPNVVPLPRLIQERPHVLLHAKRDIAKNEELVFDYGSYKDPHSTQEAWMKE